VQVDPGICASFRPPIEVLRSRAPCARRRAGELAPLKHVLEMVETVAPNDSTVLLLGETGTGKECLPLSRRCRSNDLFKVHLAADLFFQVKFLTTFVPVCLSGTE